MGQKQGSDPRVSPHLEFRLKRLRICRVILGKPQEPVMEKPYNCRVVYLKKIKKERKIRKMT